MEANTIYRGSAFKRVSVRNIPTDRGPVADGILIGYAMASAGETPGRLFGWSIGERVTAHFRHCPDYVEGQDGPNRDGYDRSRLLETCPGCTLESVMVTLNTD